MTEEYAFLTFFHKHSGGGCESSDGGNFSISLTVLVVESMVDDDDPTLGSSGLTTLSAHPLLI